MKKVTVYLFLFIYVFFTEKTVSAQTAPQPKINLPHFAGPVLFDQSAVFWLGQVTNVDNYTDVRAGYNNDELYINTSIFDRYLHYTVDPQPSDFSVWDSVSIFINTPTESYRFDGM